MAVFQYCWYILSLVLVIAEGSAIILPLLFTTLVIVITPFSSGCWPLYHFLSLDITTRVYYAITAIGFHCWLSFLHVIFTLIIIAFLFIIHYYFHCHYIHAALLRYITPLAYTYYFHYYFINRSIFAIIDITSLLAFFAAYYAFHIIIAYVSFLSFRHYIIVIIHSFAFHIFIVGPAELFKYHIISYIFATIIIHYAYIIDIFHCHYSLFIRFTLLMLMPPLFCPDITLLSIRHITLVVEPFSLFRHCFFLFFHYCH